MILQRFGCARRFSTRFFFFLRKIESETFTYEWVHSTFDAFDNWRSAISSLMCSNVLILIFYYSHTCFLSAYIGFVRYTSFNVYIPIHVRVRDECDTRSFGDRVTFGEELVPLDVSTRTRHKSATSNSEIIFLAFNNRSMDHNAVLHS